MATALSLPGGFIGQNSYPTLGNPVGGVFYVLGSTGNDNRGRLSFRGSGLGSFGYADKPLASVFGTNGALSYCVASRGDVIIVLPGHSENLATSGTYAVPAGVTILGLGYGSLRPQINLTGGTATIISMGTNSRIDNCIFTAAFDAIVSMFTLASGAQIVNCRIAQGDATNQAVTAVTLVGSSCLIQNNEIDCSLGAGAAQAIYSVSTTTRNRIINNYILGDFSAAVLKTLTLHSLEMLIQSNTLVQRNGTAKTIIDFTTGSTGIVRDNVLFGTTWAAITNAIANSTSVQLRWSQNYGFDDGAGAVSAILIPAAGTVS